MTWWCIVYSFSSRKCCHCTKVSMDCSKCPTYNASCSCAAPEPPANLVGPNRDQLKVSANPFMLTIKQIRRVILFLLHYVLCQRRNIFRRYLSNFVFFFLKNSLLPRSTDFMPHFSWWYFGFFQIQVVIIPLTNVSCVTASEFGFKW